MQKTNTKDYEFLARLISEAKLYEVRWNNQVHISYVPDLIWRMSGYNHLYTFGKINPLILASAHTVRGAWKKACKILQNGKQN